MNVDNINVLALAYLGDAIYEERVREYLIRSGISLVDDLQKETIRYVSAKNQARIISYLINTKYLTDREINIVKRGRNYKKIDIQDIRILLLINYLQDLRLW